MIPVWQTRHGLEAIGNCLEACVASILEVPLATVPDRAALVDADAWCEAVNVLRRNGGDTDDLELPAGLDAGHDLLVGWLADRGLVWLEVDVEGDRGWLDVAEELGGFWIANTRQESDGWSHATVWKGRCCVHNPDRAGTINPGRLGPIRSVVMLVASEPAKLARLQPLPDVAGELKRAHSWAAYHPPVPA